MLRDVRLSFSQKGQQLRLESNPVKHTKLHCTIVGTGDMAHGLAHLYANSNKSSLNRLEVTKPGLSTGEMFLDTGVPLVSFTESIARADIVILAIPAPALKIVVADHFSILRDKVLVDITNSAVRGEDLSSLCGLTEVQWVKAFNDIGAVDILLHKPYSKAKVATTICSPHKKALGLVWHFAEESFGMAMKNVPPVRYHDVAMHQNSLGREWVHASWIMLAIFAICETDALLRYNVFKGYAWFHLPLQVTNKGICWAALNGFAIAQVSGLVARLHNSFHSDTLRSKPQWMVWSLSIRKHVGLLSLWFLFIHIIMSPLLFKTAYYGKFFVNPMESPSKLNSIGESSFFFAILGTVLYAIMGLCSIPSIGSRMTNKQWQLIYGPIAWLALAFGTIHVLIMGVKGWTDQDKWPGGMPPITMTSVLLPLFVLWLKLVQVLFTRGHATMKMKSYRSYHEVSITDQEEKTTDFRDELEKPMMRLKHCGGSAIEHEQQREIGWL